MVEAGRTDRRGDDVVNQGRSKGGNPGQGTRTGKPRARKSLGRGRENGWDPESWLKKKTRTSKSLGRGRRKNQ